MSRSEFPEVFRDVIDEIDFTGFPDLTPSASRKENEDDEPSIIQAGSAKFNVFFDGEGRNYRVGLLFPSKNATRDGGELSSQISGIVTPTLPGLRARVHLDGKNISEDMSLRNYDEGERFEYLLKGEEIDNVIFTFYRHSLDRIPKFLRDRGDALIQCTYAVNFYKDVEFITMFGRDMYNLQHDTIKSLLDRHRGFQEDDAINSHAIQFANDLKVACLTRQ